MNGATTKIIAGVATSALAALLVAAVVGTYTATAALARLEAKVGQYMDTDTARHVDLDERVRWIERRDFDP